MSIGDLSRKQKNELLLAAARLGKINRLRRLLKQGASASCADHLGMTALHFIAALDLQSEQDISDSIKSLKRYTLKRHRFQLHQDHAYDNGLLD